MATTDQELYDSARAALNNILDGNVAEFYEGSERARLLEIDRLEKIIEKYEAKLNAASHQILRPIRRGRFA